MKPKAKRTEKNLKKPSGAVTVNHSMLSALQHKLYNGLLYAAKLQLDANPEKTSFTVLYTDLKKLLGEKGFNNVRNISYLSDLVAKKVEYNILEKDRIVTGSFAMLPSFEVVTDKKSKLTKITYEIPSKIKESMLEKEKKRALYANINLRIVCGLRSKFSIILYELVRDYQEVEIPPIKINDFRKIFGIEHKYKLIHHLRERVLNVACNELNNNKVIEFPVSYKLVKQGPRYTHVKFIVEKVKKEKKKEETKVITEDATEAEKIEYLLAMVPEKEREKAEIVIRDVFNGTTKTEKPETVELVDYVASQINYVNNYKKARSYQAVFRAALEADYANQKTKKKTLPQKTTTGGMSGGGQKEKELSPKEQYLQFLAQNKEVIEKYVQKAKALNPEVSLQGAELGTAGFMLRILAAQIWADEKNK